MPSFVAEFMPVFFLISLGAFSRARPGGAGTVLASVVPAAVSGGAA